MTALGEAALRRDGDVVRAQTCVDEALDILGKEDDPVARFDALTARAQIGGWHGDMDEVVLYMERAYALAMDAGRKDLQTIAAQVLAQTHIVRLELDEAEILLMRALELAGESGSARARAGATLAYGWFLAVKGELDAAETVYEEVRQTATELGIEPSVAAALSRLGGIAWRRQDYKLAEKLFREAVRITSMRGDRGFLPELQALQWEAEERGDLCFNEVTGLHAEADLYCIRELEADNRNLIKAYNEMLEQAHQHNSELEAEVARLKEQAKAVERGLSDPAHVHLSMRRGTIAQITPRQFAHLQGDEYQTQEARIESTEAKLRAVGELPDKWRSRAVDHYGQWAKAADQLGVQISTAEASRVIEQAVFLMKTNVLPVIEEALGPEA